VVALIKEETLFMNVIFCFVCVCVCGFVWDRGGAMKEDRKKIMKGLFPVERKNKSVFNFFSKEVFFCDFCVCDKCVVKGVCLV
jgi:hypothetical protein